MPFKGDPTWLEVPAPGVASWNRGSDAIARMLKRTKAARRITPDRRWGLPYEDVALRTEDGVDLAAWYIPGREPQDPELAVVVHHHYGGQRATVLPWLELFHRLGFATISFDARGHAASGDSPEGRGSFSKRVSDVSAGLAELRRRGFRRFVGFGQSQGASTTIMALSGRSDVVGFILDCGPAPDMLTAAWGLAGNMLGKDRDDRLARALLSARIIPGTEPLSYQFQLWLSLAFARRKKLLWIHGGQDQVIRKAWAARWYRPLHSPNWTELAVPEADHVRTLSVSPQTVEPAVAALLASLTDPAAAGNARTTQGSKNP